MPARQQVDHHIVPISRLPENTKRLGQGGHRLDQSDALVDRKIPMISVVTIVLNGEDHLEKTIQSVIAQLDDRAEYIIIDGGSKDSTVEIIQKYKQHLEYWVSEPDLGVSDAFNKGLSLCRGRVVGLLNAGDWYEPEAFDFVKKYFGEHRDTAVLCGSLQYWLGDNKAYISESRPELLGSEMSVTHPTCFIQREVYLDHGGFDRSYKFAMDYELLLRLYVHHVAFQSTPHILANMLHEGISEQNWLEALMETWRARRQYVPGSFFAGRLYLAYLIARKYVRFGMQALGMHGLVRLYRERLAPVKKRLSE